MVLLAAAGTLIALLLSRRSLVEPEARAPVFQRESIPLPPGYFPSTVPLVVDPALRCPEAADFQGETPNGPGIGPVPPDEGLELLATLSDEGQRTVRLVCDGVGYNSQGLALVVITRPDGTTECEASGLVVFHAGEPHHNLMSGISGRLTLDTLEWKLGQPVAIDADLAFAWDDPPEGGYRIHARGRAPVERERSAQPPK
jgi:hypothetical protein